MFENYDDFDLEKISESLQRQLIQEPIECEASDNYLKVIFSIMDRIYKLNEWKDIIDIKYYDKGSIKEINKKLNNRLCNIFMPLESDVIVDCWFKIYNEIVPLKFDESIEKSKFIEYVFLALKLLTNNNIPYIHDATNKIIHIGSEENKNTIIFNQKYAKDAIYEKYHDMNELRSNIEHIWDIYNNTGSGIRLKFAGNRIYYEYLFFIFIIRYYDIFLDIDNKNQKLMTKLKGFINYRLLKDKEKTVNIYYFYILNIFIRKELNILRNCVKSIPELSDLFIGNIGYGMIEKLVYSYEMGFAQEIIIASGCEFYEMEIIKDYITESKRRNNIISDAIESLNIKKLIFNSLKINDNMKKIENKFFDQNIDKENIGHRMEYIACELIDQCLANDNLKEKILINLNETYFFETLDEIINLNSQKIKSKKVIKKIDENKKIYQDAINNLAMDQEIKNNLFQGLYNNINIDKDWLNEIEINTLLKSMVDGIFDDNFKEELYNSILTYTKDFKPYNIKCDEIPEDWFYSFYNEGFYYTYCTFCDRKIDMQVNVATVHLLVDKFISFYYKIFKLLFICFININKIPIKTTKRYKSYEIKYDDNQYIIFNKDIFINTLEQFFERQENAELLKYIEIIKD